MEITTRIKPAMNFENTKLNSVMGLVSKSSNVPVLFSSENIRIVIAGISNRNIVGAKMKNGVKLDSPNSIMFWFPGETQRKKPVEIKKNKMAM